MRRFGAHTVLTDREPHCSNMWAAIGRPQGRWPAFRYHQIFSFIGYRTLLSNSSCLLHPLPVRMSDGRSSLEAARPPESYLCSAQQTRPATKDLRHLYHPCAVDVSCCTGTAPLACYNMHATPLAADSSVREDSGRAKAAIKDVDHLLATPREEPKGTSKVPTSLFPVS